MYQSSHNVRLGKKKFWVKTVFQSWKPKQKILKFNRFSKNNPVEPCKEALYRIWTISEHSKYMRDNNTEHINIINGAHN